MKSLQQSTIIMKNNITISYYPLSAIRYLLLRNGCYFSPLTDHCLLSTDYSQTEFALC